MRWTVEGERRGVGWDVRARKPGGRVMSEEAEV
jgi:hypothetical protein